MDIKEILCSHKNTIMRRYSYMRKEKNRMDFGPIQRLFGSNAVTQVIDFLSTFREFDYSINEIAENTEIHRRTVSRVLPSLEYYGVVVNVRKIDRASMYKLNGDSEIATMIRDLSTAVAEYDVDSLLKKRKFHSQRVECTEKRHRNNNRITIK